MYPGHNCHHIKSFNPPVKTIRRITIPSLNTIPSHYFFICNTKVSRARAALWVVLCTVYCILASVLLRVPPLKFPSLHINIPPHSSLDHPPSSVALSLLRLLTPSLLSLASSMTSSVPSSLVPYLNPPSLPPLPLPSPLSPFLPASLPSPLPPHSLPPSTHPPLAPSLVCGVWPAALGLLCRA